MRNHRRPALPAKQQTQLQAQKSQMPQAALEIAQMIDHKQAREAWDCASSVAKQVVKRGDFAKQNDADRAMLGAVGARKVATITRTQSEGGKLPAGIYVNVSYNTKFAKASQPVRELISFHFDRDRKWRVAGYPVR